MFLVVYSLVGLHTVLGLEPDNIEGILEIYYVCNLEEDRSVLADAPIVSCYRPAYTFDLIRRVLCNLLVPVTDG